MWSCPMSAHYEILFVKKTVTLQSLFTGSWTFLQYNNHSVSFSQNKNPEPTETIALED